ncbi:MAG: malectin domain-containing carbohydrate-binding protein [Armatimonadota bacterium]|nr:malectin domain-containing carbohydrate-binding protein [Armatimonadota bacterium]
MRRLALTMIAAMSIAGAAQAAVVISPPAKASPVEKLAARELQRYIYVRTGRLPDISSRSASERIVIARKDRAISDPTVRKTAKTLGPEQYVLRTAAVNGRRTWYIIGGDDAGVLYGAYRFVEKLGVRFYLHGDVIPDARLAKLPDVNETGKPIFSIRGINPFHDFPEGPDWWNTDDYLTYISQLAKMRMNFIGLHCYPEGIAEPTVWIGLSSDVDSRGKATFSHYSRWASTALDGPWGYAGMTTSEYTSGASLLFPQDHYGPDVMNRMLPAPGTPEQFNLVFNRAADMFGTAFSYARSLGVKTCVGTETPLTIPALVRERLKQQGKDPADPNVVQEVYKGMFERIARAYPVDYYWLWTPEGWTWGGNTEDQIKATMRDIQCALAALDSIGNPFTLATCGWVLGPAQDRAALDSILPKNCPMSCINREVGHAPVEPSFANIKDRPKWAIPWMENDPDLTAPQPWVGRMRFDAADAKRLGCTGLLGIHWRTKMMCQNVAALAAAAWDQSWTLPGFASPRAEQESRIGPLGGGIVTFQDPVENTDEDPVYQSVRYNVKGYRLIVPPGAYTVTLKFNEPHYSDHGKRVFSVKIQDKQVIEHLDIFARVGKNKALDFTFNDIRVDDAPLSIAFVYEAEFPCIAGIVIQGLDNNGRPYVRKINCGGESYRDYEADATELVDKSRERAMPVEGFYIDFARASFGGDVAQEAGRIMAKIDGRNMPEPVTWLDGPGGVLPNRTPWEKMKERYEFVDELAELRKRIREPGDLARFDYWLNTYRYTKALGHLGCLRGEIDVKAEAIVAEKDPAKQQALAREAVDLRVRLSRLWEQAIALQVAAVDTPGEMGTIDNLERHSRKLLKFLSKHDELLTKTLGIPLPREIELSKAFRGPARIIVPTVRGQAKPGESLRLKIIILDDQLPTERMLYWRPLGTDKFAKIGLRHIGRAVYEAKLPPAKSPYEYYITAKTSDGKRVWPATAPRICQTVVVW